MKEFYIKHNRDFKKKQELYKKNYDEYFQEREERKNDPKNKDQELSDEDPPELLEDET